MPIADRCHSLSSLFPPQAAVASLPIAGLVIVYGLSTSVVYGIIYYIWQLVA